MDPGATAAGRCGYGVAMKTPIAGCAMER